MPSLSRALLPLFAVCSFGQVPDPSLVARWDFQEGSGTTVADLSGNGNNGAVVNGPDWVAGINGKAFAFTGTNYVDGGGADTLKPAGALTISAWVQATLENASVPVVLFDSGSAAAYELDWKDAGSPGTMGPYFSIWSGHAADTVFYSIGNLSAGSWYFLSGTYDSQSGTLVLYVNGVLAATAQAASGTPIAYPGFGTQHVDIGAHGGTNNLRAAVEDVRIYSRALAASEIAALYAACSPPAASPVILSFTATPSTVAPGVSAMLSWSVSGAKSVSIDQGIGAVNQTSGSVVVNTGGTTAYTLTAANASGMTTAQTTVTVAGAPVTSAPRNLTVLYPPNGATLPAAGFSQTYLAAETSTPSTCGYSAQDVPYSAMTPFTNTGNAEYHTNLLALGGTGTFSYYISCQDDASGLVTPATATTFSIGQIVGYIPANLTAVATSPTSVLLSWTDPSPGNSQSFTIYRNGAPAGTTKTTNYLDTNLTANTLYRYSVADVVGNVTQAATISAPAMTVPVTTTASAAPVAILNDFESGALRVMNPTETRPDLKYLWGQYPFSDLANVQLSDGLANPTQATSESGSYSIAVTLSGYLPPAGSTYDGITVGPGMFTEPGTAYLSLYPYTEATNLWSFAKEYLTAGTWQNDTYNRLRFWVKVPSGFTKFYDAANPGQTTMDFGTYISSSHASHLGSGGAESGFGGDHYYHRFRLIPTSQWQEVIVDMHPHHQRGGVGSMEWGNMPYPTGEAGINYFDSLTRFYLDFSGADPSTGQLIQFSSYPVTFYFDNFAFYKDTNPENDMQVFAISGTYNPATNELEVSWAHPKNDGVTPHEVRYAFQDIYSLTGAAPLDKWNQATPAPGGTLVPYDAVYNMMEYRTTAIPAAGQSTIFVAIKPQGAATFRQIAIPLGR
jgi:hypothetical protein